MEERAKREEGVEISRSLRAAEPATETDTKNPHDHPTVISAVNFSGISITCQK
jgi:hypothetical protein